MVWRQCKDLQIKSFQFFDIVLNNIQASWICMDKKYFGVWTCHN